MAISIFDLFSIGIGPSSSHTVGPMRAAKKFAQQALNQKKEVSKIKVELYGSLALTGKGHATDIAILLGLEGYTPEGVQVERVQKIIERIREKKKICLEKEKTVAFDEQSDFLWYRDKTLPFHPNAMRFTAFTLEGDKLLEKIYYSIGGGFIIDHEKKDKKSADTHSSTQIPYPFKKAETLFEYVEKENLSIAQIVLENEKMWRSEKEIYDQLLHIWGVMEKSIEKGCVTEGILPGGLNVKRRAPELYKKLKNGRKDDPASIMDWLSLWALAVNEENAACGRVVTAPTNGSSGVIPSVIKYYKTFYQEASDNGIITFLLTAGAMGILFKEGASISAAEMGCMGEVGVACAMAAGGLTAALGGTTKQIEMATEIGMEHNLGLTCDPIKGLVQIPCIERNTMGAVKAVNASRLALNSDGKHKVSLSSVIKTMKQTGHDMKSIYKETSLGGLAVNVPEC